MTEADEVDTFKLRNEQRQEGDEACRKGLERGKQGGNITIAKLILGHEMLKVII
jgi:hypothetical protein